MAKILKVASLILNLKRTDLFEEMENVTKEIANIRPGSHGSHVWKNSGSFSETDLQGMLLREKARCFWTSGNFIQGTQTLIYTHDTHTFTHTLTSRYRYTHTRI